MLSLFDWLRSQHPAITTPSARCRSSLSRSFRSRCVCPNLEALEDRLLLSTITPLGLGTAYAINNNGVVVGEVQNNANQEVAFLYNGTKQIPINGGEVAYGISDTTGLVVGAASSGNGSFVYNSGSQQTTLFGQELSVYEARYGPQGPGPGLGINPSGSTVVGTDQNDQAFEASSPYSTQKELLPPSGYTNSGAVGINDNGQVAGLLQINNSTPHAALYSGGQWQDVGMLLKDPSSAATAINAAGDLVGFSNTAPDGVSGTYHAFLFTGGTPIVLPALSGHTNSAANGINSDGWIVGSAGGVNTTQVAVLWKNGTPVDLNTLLPQNSGWQLTDAYAINDADQIIGTGFLNGTTQAFLLNLNAANNTGSGGGGGGVGGGGGGGGVEGGKPTQLQAVEGLLFDGIGLAIDMLTHQSTTGIQANIAFDMPYAGPLGQVFLNYSFAASLNAFSQNSQLLQGIELLQPHSSSSSFSSPIAAEVNAVANFIDSIEETIAGILHPQPPVENQPSPIGNNSGGNQPGQPGTPPSNQGIAGTYVGTAETNGAKAPGSQNLNQPYHITLTINNTGSGSITLNPDPLSFSGTFTGQIQQNADGTYNLSGVELSGTHVDVQEAKLVGNQLNLKLDVYTGPSSNPNADLSWDQTGTVPFYLTKQ